MRFAQKLKSERKKYGLTQSELAKCLQVSQVSISYWESGLKEPSFQELIDLANIFHITVDEMLGIIR